MATVTQRVSKIKQPYGGYLPLKYFSKERLEDGQKLNENENIPASLIGLAVDYLTRFLLGDSVDKAFHISCLGASNIGMLKKATMLKANITGLDDLSITSACKLAGFDVCYRASTTAYKPIEDINPDTATIENIRIMASRSMLFWERYGPVVCSEITFEGGYTAMVNAGDGDYISNDTLWDFKVSKSSPTTKHSLQILMYYVMGLHSTHEYYKNISNLGFYNPRLNIVYICPVNRISAETIMAIENDVLCYGVPLNQCKFDAPNSSENNYQADELSVAEVCDLTGLKKKLVYADIRSGALNAYKKKNKYYIKISEYQKYKKKKDLEKKLTIILEIIIAIISIAIILYVWRQY